MEVILRVDHSIQVFQCWCVMARVSGRCQCDLFKVFFGGLGAHVEWDIADSKVEER